MHVVLTWICYAAEAFLHYWMLAGPIHLGAWILHSDSLVSMTPSTLDLSQNVTEMEFGIADFAVNGTEDIHFSDVQMNELFRREKVIGRVFTKIPLMVISLIVILPFLWLVYRAWCKRQGWRVETWIPMLRTYKNFIPLIAISTLLYLVSIFIMLQSSLCGPNYIELGYVIEEDENFSDYRRRNSTGYDDDYDCYGPDAYGTGYTIHEDVGVSCEVGTSAIGFSVLTIMWATLFLGIEWLLLRRRINKMEQIVVVERKAEEATTIDVEEGKVDTKDSDDDASTQPGSERDLQIY